MFFLGFQIEYLPQGGVVTKELLSPEKATELIQWWAQMDRRDVKSRQIWLQVYEQSSFAGLGFKLRLKLDLIARVNKHTLPKEKMREDAG